jgi:hypothetical protein
MPWGGKVEDCLPRGAGTRCFAFVKVESHAGILPQSRQSGTAIGSVMRNLGGSIGISVLVYIDDFARGLAVGEKPV